MRADARRAARATAWALGAFTAPAMAAQVPTTDRTGRDTVTPQPLGVDATGAALVTLGSAEAERLRVAQLTDRASADGYLLRAPSLLSSWLRTRQSAAVWATPVRPELVTVYNSRVATALNDGALWSGRGTNALLRGGVAVRAGRLTLLLVPELGWSQNRGFQSVPASALGQFPPTGPFAAPWYTGPYAADLPVRFGDQPYATLTSGQSAAYVTTGPVAVGLSTENQWWGPGVRNALLLSDAAEGVPHAFVRTARPLRTRLGEVEARWIFGGLTPSLYFVAEPDREEGRTLSGAVATLRLAADTGLTIGVARLVVAPGRSPARSLGRAFDVFARNASLSRGDTLDTSPRVDQLASLFARWVFRGAPGAGAELYAEYARLELPRSPRDFLLGPGNTGAFTLGFANAWRPRAADALRASFELTNLEQSRTFSDRPATPDYYTGRAAPAGFTNRGQALGAAIGPGSQSQWAALDYYAGRWQAGLFAERVRHQNDAMYRQFLANLRRHDVSFAGGVRGGYRLRHVDARATLGVSNRINYLFQSGAANYERIGTADLRNVNLQLSLSPRLREARRP